MSTSLTEKTVCRCTACGKMQEVRIHSRHNSKVVQSITCYCYDCKRETVHLTVNDKKQINQFRSSREKSRQQRVANACARYGFKHHFGEQHAFVKTPIGTWFFNYLDLNVTLFHESSKKINRRTGDYSPYHIQFENREMSIEKVISFIAQHEKYRTEERERNECDNRMLQYKCGDCGYQYTFTERGEVLDKGHYKRFRKEILAGDYGKRAREFFIQHNRVEYTVRTMVYQCSKCGDLQGMQYFRMDSGDVHYTWRQVCEKCNSYTMRMVPYNRLSKIACPVCGGTDHIECEAIRLYAS